MEHTWLPLANCPQPFLQQNLQALASIQPELARILNSHQDRDDILLRQAPSGLLACKYRNKEGEYTVHGAIPVRDEAATFAGRIIHSFQNHAWLAIVYGTGMGVFLPAVVSCLETQFRGEAKGVICIEQDPGLLCAGFCMYNYVPLIKTGRILFALGPNTDQSLHTLYQEHHFSTLSEEQISYSVGYKITDPQRESDYHYAIRQCRFIHQDKRQDYLDLLQQAEIYWSSEPKEIQRIWAQINDERAAGSLLHGLIDGFQDCEITARVLTFRDNLFTRLYRCAYDFYTATPDLILCINHSSNYIVAFAQTIPIPRLIWFVDHPSRTVDVAFNPNDIAIAVSPSFFPEIEKRGGTPIGVVPAGCPANMDKPPLHPHYIHDVSYVGSVVDTTPVTANVHPAATEWINTIVEAQLAHPLHDLSHIIHQSPPPEQVRQKLDTLLPTFFSKAAYMSPEQLLLYFLYTQANTAHRLRYMLAVAEEVSLGIYGPADWLRILPAALQPHYHGTIDTVQDLHQLYRKSKINLSINSLQGFGFVNPRIFDVPAAGGFILAEYTPGLEEMFECETEIVWFQDDEELCARIQNALADEGKRLAAISRVQKKLLAQHTYQHRAQHILTLMQEYRQAQQEKKK
jgi:hypothetical protein